MRIHFPEALAEHPLLIYNEDFALSRQLLELFSQHNVKPRIAVRSGQWDFLAAMVQAGVGIAILPEPICQRLDKQTLRWIPLESDLRWQLGMIWREGVYLSHSARRGSNAVKGFGYRKRRKMPDAAQTPYPAYIGFVGLISVAHQALSFIDSRSTALPASPDRAATFAAFHC